MGRVSTSRSHADLQAVQVIENEGRVYNSTLEVELQKAAGTPFRLMFGVSEGLQYFKNSDGNAIPQEFSTALQKDLNGCFGSRYNRDASGAPVSHDTWCCFKIKQVSTDSASKKISYYWDQISILTRWHTRHTDFVLCLDMPSDMQKRLSLHLHSVNGRDAYAWLVVFLAEIRDRYDFSVWSLRHPVRDIEKARDDSQPDFPRFHEIARHIIHSNETLDVAVDTVNGTINEHEMFCRERQSDEPEAARSRDLHQRLYYFSRELRAIKRRSESLYERLQNEINLAFNLISQRDSQIAVEVGQYAQKDNNVMKTMAAVGLVFLPGTFVSSLFGMSFFDFDPDGQTWSVSDKFWIYWVITCPLTILTIITWAAWHYWSSLKAVRLSTRRRDLKSRTSFASRV